MCVHLKELLEQYQQQRQPRTPTLRQMQLVLRLLKQDCDVDHVAAIDRDVLNRWRDATLARASSATWANYYRHFRALWRFGAQAGLTDGDVLIRVRERLARPATARCVPQDTIRRAIQSLEADQCGPEPRWFWAMVVRAMALTGMRRRQVVTVRWRDIDLVAGTLKLSSEGSKTEHEWTIALHMEVVVDLCELLQRHQRRQRTPQPADQVWNVTLWDGRYRGTRLTDGQLSGFFKRLAKALDTPITAHGLRHALATELCRQGGVALAQQVLGHTDIRVTMGYVSADLDHQRQIFAGISTRAK